jgi:large subunit ribosomal protein L15
MLQVAIDNKSLDASKPVDAKALVAAGVIARANDGISLINTGTLKGKVNLTVTKATKGAIAAVEKAGGKVDVLPAKVNKLLKPGKTPKRQAAREAAIAKAEGRRKKA